MRIAKLQHCGVAEVYDLTVPSTENFSINGGIIVHNCADVSRYMLMTLHESKAAAPKSPVEAAFERMKQQANAANLNERYYG